METVPALFASGLKQLEKEDLLVDLSQVDAVDSAAISMLLGWARAARRSQHQLQVKAFPEGLISLARLYGVDAMLPQQSG